MPSAPYGQVGEFAILVGKDGVPATFASEFVVLVSTGAPPSRYTPATELAIIASTQQDKVMVQVSQFLALVSYAAEATEQFNSRAWGFSLDQHQFYVLHAGVEGTLVYDILTQEWAQWQTQGFDTWNAENGVEWNGDIYFGDRDSAALWRLDTTSFLDDEFRPIKRIVTGGIPAEGRNTLKGGGPCVLSATKEAVVDEVSIPYVQLSISDDGGETWNDREAITVDPATPVQDFSWRGLGAIKAPGRVFKITDEGGFVTIRGLDQPLYGEDDKDD